MVCGTLGDLLVGSRHARVLAVHIRIHGGRALLGSGGDVDQEVAGGGSCRRDLRLWAYHIFPFPLRMIAGCTFVFLVAVEDDRPILTDLGDAY